MPRFIVKPTTDRDVYVVWSTVADAPVEVGSRDYLTRHLPSGERGASRFDRADLSGTSATGEAAGWLGWSERTFPLGEGPGDDSRQVSRERLAEYALHMDRGDTAAAYALTTSYDPEAAS
jgi:hypothetical protein